MCTWRRLLDEYFYPKVFSLDSRAAPALYKVRFQSV
jgi:hypothetical protein